MTLTARDVLLVVRAQTGDRSALDRLLTLIQEPLLAYIQLLVGSRDEALDVLQDTLFLAARKLPRLREPALFRAWAYRIATRQAARKRRVERAWTTAVRGDELAGLSAPEVDERFDAELLQALPARVSELPPACGAVMRMHYLDGFSYEEISEALDLPMGTVKSRLAYGRGLLKKTLRD